MTVGERAALLIYERSEMTGMSECKIIEKMGGHRKTLHDWRDKNINPSAYWLQQLALFGFDVHWILTGEKRYTGTDNDFELAGLEEE